MSSKLFPQQLPPSLPLQRSWRIMGLLWRRVRFYFPICGTCTILCTDIWLKLALLSNYNYNYFLCRNYDLYCWHEGWNKGQAHSESEGMHACLMSIHKVNLMAFNLIKLLPWFRSKFYWVRQKISMSWWPLLQRKGKRLMLRGRTECLSVCLALLNLFSLDKKKWW